ncbi:MAG: NAD(P)/FAD-dependent oxidoreductase [Fusobacteriaceae bacterium]
MYDILIVGAGIIGSGIARELSRYNLKIAVLDRDTDVANGTTKANSAIIHAGYDPEPGTLMAKYNIPGNAMYEELCRELHVDFKRNGSLVLAFDEKEKKHLEMLLERGEKNGVPGMKILSKEEVKKIETNVAEEIVAALHAPTAGIISPWEFTAALIDNAVENGAELFLNTEVVSIGKLEEGFEILTNNGIFKSKNIINCAGVHTDIIHNMIAPPSYRIEPRRGQYYVLDKAQGARVNHTVFQCPNEFGKGVLVTPTTHGNLLVGPDSQGVGDRDNLSTTAEQLEYIRTKGSHSIKDINFRESIRNFSGMRAESDRQDFIIEESLVKGFFDVAGIKSPGLSAAPAIFLAAADMVREAGVILEKKNSFIPPREHKIFMEMDAQEKAELIKKDSAYGRIICRCEMITEGEIIDAIHRPVSATTLDAVKRRCRPGMGRCQGGFCGPRVQEIVARELNIPLEEVMLDKRDSYILTEETKG